MKVYLVIKVLFYISRVHPHCYCGVEKVQVKSRNNVLEQMSNKDLVGSDLDSVTLKGR